MPCSVVVSLWVLSAKQTYCYPDRSVLSASPAKSSSPPSPLSQPLLAERPHPQMPTNTTARNKPRFDSCCTTCRQPTGLSACPHTHHGSGTVQKKCHSERRESVGALRRRLAEVLPDGVTRKNPKNRPLNKRRLNSHNSVNDTVWTCSHLVSC